MGHLSHLLGKGGETSTWKKVELEVKTEEIWHRVQSRLLQRHVRGRRVLLCCQHPVLTFVAVAHRVEVDVVLVAAEEEEAEPGVEGVDGHDEEDADDVALLLGDGVVPQVRVDLQRRACPLHTAPARTDD